MGSNPGTPMVEIVRAADLNSLRQSVPVSQREKLH